MTYFSIFGRFCKCMGFKIEKIVLSKSFCGEKENFYALNMMTDISPSGHQAYSNKVFTHIFIEKEADPYDYEFNKSTTHFIQNGTLFHSRIGYEDAAKNLLTDMSGKKLVVSKGGYPVEYSPVAEFPKFSTKEELMINLNLQFGLDFDVKKGKTDETV